MLDSADRSEIKCVGIFGYYDGPIDGWVRVDRGYYYFKIATPISSWHRYYNIYFVEKPVRIPHLLNLRLFRHLVGWHMTRFPGKDRRWFNGDHQSEQYRRYYNTPKPPKIAPADMKHVGVSDLKKEIIWIHSIEEYDRNWKYVECEEESE